MVTRTRSALWSILAIAPLVACQNAQPTLELGELSGGEQELLERFGITDLARSGSHVLLRGSDGTTLGRVELEADGGYSVRLNGLSANVRARDGFVQWSCDDGHAGSGEVTAGGLFGLLALDPTLGDAPCAWAVATGWIVGAAYTAPPDGCRRVVSGADAALECEHSGLAVASLGEDCADWCRRYDYETERVRGETINTSSSNAYAVWQESADRASPAPEECSGSGILCRLWYDGLGFDDHSCFLSDHGPGRTPRYQGRCDRVFRHCRYTTRGGASEGGAQLAGVSCTDSCDHVRCGPGHTCQAGVCVPVDPCEGSTDPCCGSTDPCCGSTDACCGSTDPCCGTTDPCCGSNDECCGSTDPCCGSNDECCGNPDPCCGVWCPGESYCFRGSCVDTDVEILCDTDLDCDGAPCVDGHCSAER